MSLKHVTSPSALTLMIFSIVVIAIVSLHTYHFAGRDYRQDEAWLVDSAIVHMGQPGGLLKVASDNFTSYASEYFPMEVWVALFGQTEPITRFLATLLTSITLAFVFRIGKDLFNAQVGLFGVFVLGTLSFFEFFSHEARPYPALATGAAAAVFLFERWLRYRRPIYAVSYVITVIATLYIHIYIVYVVAAQVAFFVLFVKWNRALWTKTVALFAFTAIFSIPRLVTIFFRYRGPQGGISWYSITTNSDAFVILHSQMQIAPVAIGQFLLLLGIVVPVAVVFPHSDRSNLFRFKHEWNKIYLVAVPLIVLGLALTVNLVVKNVTPRNLIVILPPLAVLIGYALVCLPWQGRAIIAILITIPAFTNFTPYIANGPYLAMTAFIQQDFQTSDRFVVEGAQFWQHDPIVYYVRRRLSEPVPNEAFFHLLYNDNMGVASMPDPPIHWVQDDSTSSLDSFRAFIDHSQRVWYLQSDPVDFDAAYKSIIDSFYIPYRVQTWGPGQNYPPHTFIEYRRIPQHFENQYVFDNNFTLRHWDLKNDAAVTPCETVSLESWWSIQRVPQTNYSMTLTLADASGMGIAHNDSSPAGVLTQLWQPNQLYLDARSIVMPCDIQPGDYSLIVNLYDYQMLKSLPITNVPQNTAYLTTLRVR